MQVSESGDGPANGSRVLTIDHVQITVPSDRVEEARRFYCGLLGLRQIDKPEPLRGRGGFWCDSGGIQLHVSPEDGVDRMSTKAHVAYEVDDLEVWRERVAGSGCVIAESVPLEGIARFEFRDPFGNRVELLQRLSADTPSRSD